MTVYIRGKQPRFTPVFVRISLAFAIYRWPVSPSSVSTEPNLGLGVTGETTVAQNRWMAVMTRAFPSRTMM